jgi:predicted permease
MNLRDLKLRARALFRPRRVERDLDDELAFHIACEAQKLVERGMAPDEAARQARARFGPVPLAADQCRDARGTAFVDQTARDVAYAWRTFRRAPLSALTIVATVALGLGLVTVVFTFYNAWYLQSDALRDPDELFAIQRPPHRDSGNNVYVSFTQGEYQALRAETTVFTDIAATLGASGTRIDGRPVSATHVSGNFFHVLGVSAALGRTLTPADDEAGGPVVVLSHRGWTRLFAADPAIVGRRVAVNGVPHEIAGVTPPAFRGPDFTPDYWAPLSLAARLPSNSGREATLFRVIGRLAGGVSPEAATSAVVAWAAGHPELTTSPGQGVHVRLIPLQELSRSAVQGLKTFSPLFVAFGLVLLIGCANVANLLLARGMARQREIGVRLALGASRIRIVRQLFTEALLLALASAAAAFVVAQAFIAGALRLLMTTVPPEFADLVSLVNPAADWRVPLFLLLGAILSTLSFGLAPALQATRLELVRTMRGELRRDVRPGRARQALIAIQVTASALLLICAAVFLRSALDVARADPGVRTSDTVIVDFANEPLREALVGALRTHPSVAVVAASSPGPMGHLRPATVEAVPDDPVAAARRATVAYQFVSPEYFDVLDIRLRRGRGFTPDERSAASGVVVVSESTARELWPDGEALGQVVRMKVDLPSPAILKSQTAGAGAYTVVGVARDIGMRLQIVGMSFASPDVYLPTSPLDPATSFTLRVHGDPDHARQTLLADLTRVDPALVGVGTLRTMAAIEGYIMRAAFVVALAAGALALVLTLSGLFGVLSYMIEQRRQEIGVRMALGATTNHVIRLVLSQSLRPVGLGLLVGAVLAVSLGRVLLAAPIGAFFSEVVRVSDPVAYAASLIVIAAACVLAALVPALRAARIDPIATLREE